MSNKMKRRSKARELALQTLYQLDLTKDDDRKQVDKILAEQDADKEPRDFARDLVYGTLDHKDEIDEMISEVTQNWAIARMAVIDRNVLRLATHELLHRDDIPPKVSINEAIEIGKRFSTTNSGAFINGVLDKIMNHYLPDKVSELNEGEGATVEEEGS